MSPQIGLACDALPAEVRQLLQGLASEDARTNGSPVVPDQSLPVAQAWLKRILIDTLLRMAHVDELARLYHGTFRVPRLRRDWPEAGRPAEPAPDPAFRHRDLLAEPKALAVAEKGVSALAPDELARVLLDPL